MTAGFPNIILIPILLLCSYLVKGWHTKQQNCWCRSTSFLVAVICWLTIDHIPVTNPTRLFNSMKSRLFGYTGNSYTRNYILLVSDFSLKQSPVLMNTITSICMVCQLLSNYWYIVCRHKSVYYNVTESKEIITWLFNWYIQQALIGWLMRIDACEVYINIMCMNHAKAALALILCIAVQ